MEIKQDNKQLEEFNKINADSLKMVGEVKDLVIKDIDDKIGYDATKAGKMRLVRQRTFINKERKSITKVLDDCKTQIIDKEKELLKTMKPTEEKLAERIVEIDKEREKQHRLKTLDEKKDKLKKIDLELDDSFILTMDEKQFDEFCNDKKAEYLEEKELKLKKVQEELDHEKELEEARKKAEEEVKEQAKRDAELEKERVINARKEAERKAEKEKEDALKKAEDEKQEILRQAEREKQRVIDEQKRKDNERILQEAEKKAIEDKRILQEKEEKKEMEKKKKYTDWLEKHGCTKETEDDFYVLNNAEQSNKFTIYKKLDEITI